MVLSASSWFDSGCRKRVLLRREGIGHVKLTWTSNFPFDYTQSESLLVLIISAVGTIITGFAIHFALKTTRIRPGEPPLFPGALPLLGHVIQYGKDSNKIFHAATIWSKDRHPISLSLAGKRLYVMLNQKDVSAAWRSKALSFDRICEWGMIRLFGMSVSGSAKMHADPDGHGDLYINQHRFWRDSLAPGEQLNSLTQIFLGYLETNINDLANSLPKDNLWTEVSLLPWTRDRIGISATNAIAGPNLLKIEPKIMEQMTEWESNFFFLTLGLPKWIMRRPREILENMIKTWMKLGVDTNMLPVLLKRTHMVIARGADEWDVAATNISLWLGTQANANPSAFWLLYQILLLPAEMRAILETEMAPAFDPVTNRLFDLNHLIHKTPLLYSIYWEVLRHTAGSISVREVEEDTMLGGYRLYKGGMVMLPLRLNHFNEEIWGDDVNEFVPDRFIRDISGLSGNKKSPGISLLKPFGGGTSLCPGRHFAISEILAFVATAMRKFDLEIVEGQKVAVSLTSAPSIGTLPPDRDVRVRFKMRKFV